MSWQERFEDVLRSKFKWRYPGDAIFSRHFPEFVAELPKLDLPIPAIIQLLDAGYTEIPPCTICGKKLATWRYDPAGWRNFTCGRQCAGEAAIKLHGEEITAARKATLLQNYGVDNPMRSSEIQARKRATTLERYGVEHTSQAEGFNEKVEATNLERYGVRRPIQNRQIFENLQQTNLERYGVPFAISNPEIAERLSQSIARNNSIEKRKRTMLKRYGVEWATQHPTVQHLARQTSLRNWGVPYPNQSPEVLAKTRKTSLERWGTPYPNQSPKLRIRLQTAWLQRYGADHPTKWPKTVISKLTSPEFWQEEYVNNLKSVRQIGKELGVSQSNALMYFHACGFTPDKNRGYTDSSEERDFSSYVASLISIQTNVKFNQLGGSSTKSLDVYIPELKLAFEYNGLYWHSEEYRDADYHLQKTLECERLGIRLVHVWSDDWLCKPALMQRKIQALLNYGKAATVYARRCSIRIPSILELREFYKANHVKGFGSGSISYGLYHQNQLVAAITFKDMADGVYDLNRYATSCNVPGGFSKLLKHFQRNHQWSRIYTFADRSWSQGNVYRQTGFQLVEEQPPTFHGIEDCTRVNRLHYTLGQLQARFPDLTGTQKQIMDQAGIRRIWDCGQLKFELVREK